MKNLARWFPLLLCAAAVLAYSNSFSAPFLMDDRRMILENANLHSLWPPWKAILCAPRWISDLTFAVNFAIGGYTPADFRITNILIHALASLLLFGAVRRTLRLPRFRERFGARADLLAFTIALLWVVHPLGTNCVTYISQRIEALMALFFLASLYCFVRSIDSPHPRLWSNCTIAACALGMGTKEVMATAPLMLFLYDGLLVSSSWSAALRARWKLHLALWLTILLFALFLLMNVGMVITWNAPLLGSRCPPWNYLLTQTEIITHYLRLVFRPDALCFHYRWPPATGLREVWPYALFVTALGLLTLGGLLRRKAFAYPLAWMFIILAPTSSFLPIPDAAFEHRMYLPLAGVIGLTVIGAYALWQKGLAGWTVTPRIHAWFFLLFTGLAVCLLAHTRMRNLDFLSVDRIWRDVIAKRPGNYLGYIATANGWASQGQNQKAIEILEDLLPRIPDYSRMTYTEIMRAHEADLASPLKEYSMAHDILGFTYLNLGQTNQAVRHLRESIRVRPERPTPYLNLGRIAMADGKTDEAAAWLKLAYAMAPLNLDVLCTLASVESIRKNWAAASGFYRAALRLNPTHGFARAQLAWIQATCPDKAFRDGQSAVSLAEPLVDMSRGRSPKAFDILGAAYAENGQFDKAMECARQALNLLDNAVVPQPGSDPEWQTNHADSQQKREEFHNRLLLYQQRMPYHEAP